MNNTFQATAKTHPIITEKAIPGGWPPREADHRFLKPAVPRTIGDQQTAMALLGFFGRVDEVERRPARHINWAGLLSQFSLATWLARATRWVS